MQYYTAVYKNTIDTYRQNIETSFDSVNETFKVTLDMTAISELIEMNKNIIVETQTKARWKTW